MRFSYLLSILFVLLQIVLQPFSASAAPVAVVNGVASLEGEQPWVVGILQAQVADVYEAQFCGGTLIAPEWVLTAAHCTFSDMLRPFRPTDLEVMAGQHQLTTNSVERIQVDRVIRHRDFDVNTHQHDIALLHLSKALPLSQVTLADTTDANLEMPEVMAQVAGWGVTADGNGAEQLQRAELPLVETETCRQQYAEYGHHLLPGMLCAGYLDGGVDVCAGDSGGPLAVWNTETNRWTQIGIVSWGAGCAKPGAFGVYTQISSYHEWIETITSDNLGSLIS